MSIENNARPGRGAREWVDAIVLDDMPRQRLPLRHTDFEGPPLVEGNEARELGLLLLDVHYLAHQAEIGEFEGAFFSILHEHLAFDAGWTGRATYASDWPVLQYSYLHRLPHSFFSEWQTVRDLDPLANLTLGAFGKAAVISIVQPDIPGPFRDWGVKYGLAQLMCVCALDRRNGLTTFLSLYRNALTQPFTSCDMEIVENLIPHLATAIDVNRSCHIARMREEATSCGAICDIFGTLHYADKAFRHMAATEWPDWDGKQLPGVFAEHLLRHARELYVGAHISVRISTVAGLFHLEAASRSALDVLSAREIVVLRLYGEGLTYKEVARRMSISPTTVRHHLRNAYKKLGVCNKAQILRILNSGGAGLVVNEA